MMMTTKQLFLNLTTFGEVTITLPLREGRAVNDTQLNALRAQVRRMRKRYPDYIFRSTVFRYDDHREFLIFLGEPS